MINIALLEKRTSVSIRYNAYYKLVILLSIIHNCGRANVAGLQLIHLVFWALRDDKNYQVLLDLKKNIRDSLVPWSFEFGIEKVLAIGYIEDYIDKRITTNQLQIYLTDNGCQVLNSLENDDLFQEEIEKIKAIGKIAKSRLDKANSNWKLI